tara:strand:- start:3423 stop:3578 length:156 start_codon:yes stop_codon:yes gene_type:complete
MCLVGIGINLPLIGFGIILGEASLVVLAFMSGTLCCIGYRSKANEDNDQKH